jgi:hypothetical protein
MLAPKPEVVHLPTIFRRIKSGGIRVPAFQREFVWKEAQVLALLASVYQGYPIGSILLWRVDRAVLRIQDSVITAFPDLPLSFPLSFVLDGMQRLSTLYGVCNYEGPQDKDHIFNVVFDLVQNEFVHYDASEVPTHYVPLSALFSPKRLMELQIELVKHPNSTQYLETIVDLHAKFQEYLVPTVTIENQDVTNVVNIFERVNNTGTKLSSVDFMRAVTWSDEFDLSSEIRKIQAQMEVANFRFADDTIVKALGIVNDLDPLPDILLKLRDLSASRLKDSITKVATGLEAVLELLRAQFSIFGSDYVPYEGQILVLFKALTFGGNLSVEQSSELKRWFWTTGFNEALRGKPDNFVARTINSVEPILIANKGTFAKRLQVTPFEFRGRRFIKGKALSATMATMLANNRARSFVTGEVIPVEDYMTEWTARQFVPVVPAFFLKITSDDNFSSGRLLCNIVVASLNDLQAFAAKDVASMLTDSVQLSNFEEVLQSQFINVEAVEHLRRIEPDEFLDIRANLLFEGAREMSLAE